MPAAKLKIMGVDVFSAGDWSEQNAEPVRFEDRALGIYKKLTVRDGKLVGAILVGDTSDSHRYMDWLRTDADISGQRRHLLFPPPSADAGGDVASMSDSATICGCIGVTKGTIIQAIHEKGVNTMSQLKECTRASTSCGSCTGLCQDLLRAVAPEFEEERKKVICACLPFAEDTLRDILRSQKLKSVQEVLDIYGNGMGCEVCKPALSYMLDMLWCGDHDEDRSARYINDRVHANIQKDGTFSVIPRMRGGVTTPDELRRIADVADKYHVPMVKVTGSQRIDLLGVKKADLPSVWADLGMPSGPGLHEGRPHGEDLRRHRVLPLRHAGLDRRRHRAGAALREPVHAAQGEDGHRRLPAQLRRGHGEGHRPGRPGGRLAGGGRRRRRQERAQGRSADHGRDHRSRRSRPPSSSSSTTASTPTTWSAPTTSWSGWASRRCARRRCTRPSPCAHALLDRLQKSKARATRCVARGTHAEDRLAVRADSSHGDGGRMSKHDGFA